MARPRNARRRRGSSEAKTVNEEEEKEDHCHATNNLNLRTYYKRDTARAINSAHNGDTSAGASLNTA